MSNGDKSLRIVLSANAKRDVGGQGVNLAQFADALEPEFDVTVFSQAQGDIPASLGVKVMDAIPVVRGFYGRRDHLANSHFDRCVAARMPAADVFQGVTGQCLASMRRARQMGAFTVLDCITTHVDDFFEKQVSENKWFGISHSVVSAARRMALDEYAEADQIRVMSHHSQQTLVERGVAEERVFVANPYLALDEFSATDFSAPVFRVSFVGMLVPAKGFRYLLDAFARFEKKDSELILWSSPGSRLMSEYMKRALARDPRVRMRPDLVRGNYKEVYGRSHVLVHPSLADGYSYAVMEGMASGLPVIVTSATGSAELIRDGENGYVVPPGDSDAILERLIHLAKNPDLLLRMGAAARDTIRKQSPAAFRESYGERIRSFVQEKQYA